MRNHISTRPLEALATVTMGQSPESTMVNANERGLPFLQGCAEFGSRYPTSRLHCSPPLRVAKAGSTLISVRAPVGTMNRAEQDYCIGRGLAAVLAKPGEANDVFLLSAIEHAIGYLHRRSQGSTFLAVGSDDLRSIPVPAPGIETQRWLAELVSTVDEAIDQTEALITKTQQIKAGLMRDLFTRGVTPDGQLRPSREEAPKLYKESPLGWIPKEWEQSAIGQIASLVTSGSRGWAAYYASAGALFVRSQNVRMGNLDFTDRQYVTPPRGSEGQRTQLCANDLLVTITGNSVGNVAFVPHNWSEVAFVSQHVGLVRLHEPRLAEQVMNYLAPGSPGNQQLLDAQYGQSKPGLNLDNLRDLWVPMPAEAERVAIVERISGIRSRLEGEVGYAGQLQALKSGLMQDLLSGRVGVPVAEAQKVATNV